MEDLGRRQNDAISLSGSATSWHASWSLWTDMILLFLFLFGLLFLFLSFNDNQVSSALLTPVAHKNWCVRWWEYGIWNAVDAINGILTSDSERSFQTTTIGATVPRSNHTYPESRLLETVESPETLRRETVKECGRPWWPNSNWQEFDVERKRIWCEGLRHLYNIEYEYGNRMIH